MSLYVFDFDGVLFDTARECLSVAYAASRKTRGAASERWSDTEVPPPEVEHQFLSNRHLVGPPWQYALLLDCIARDAVPQTTAEFVEIANARKAALVSFTDLYFATRDELSQDVQQWCSVIRPYEALQAFERLHAAGRAAVLSTRDDDSINKIFGHFARLTPVLLPRAGGREKWQILLEQAEQRNLARNRVFFIDDYAHHAIPAHEHGFAAHLALWGYLGVDDVHNARAGGLPCLHLTDLDPALARHEENK